MPFAFTVGLRRSVDTRSCRYDFGSAQSHSVITTLRSTPCGRRGAVAGTSPAAIRSVHSANNCKARVWPRLSIVASICAPAWPDWTRRSHAATLEPSSRYSAGISRVPFVPSWWHAVHPPDFMVRIQSSCDFTLGAMPFPLNPVPGNSLLSGTRSIDSQ